MARPKILRETNNLCEEPTTNKADIYFEKYVDLSDGRRLWRFVTGEKIEPTKTENESEEEFGVILRYGKPLIIDVASTSLSVTESSSTHALSSLATVDLEAIIKQVLSRTPTTLTVFSDTHSRVSKIKLGDNEDKQVGISGCKHDIIRWKIRRPGNRCPKCIFLDILQKLTILGWRLGRLWSLEVQKIYVRNRRSRSFKVQN
ncbi:hypothetical protein Fot_07067 [Forsythia ovata]|uniref:Uncharacterized protein n=1 Tax=Forsythia ovata TaxID=205694 RepID=A0ABD1WXN0_9LAMI